MPDGSFAKIYLGPGPWTQQDRKGETTSRTSHGRRYLLFHVPPPAVLLAGTKAIFPYRGTHGATTWGEPGVLLKEECGGRPMSGHPPNAGGTVSCCALRVSDVF
jgi:hypothetical protein